MIAWIQNALKKLSPDELERVMRKVQLQYKQGGKVVSVNRSENRTQVSVQLSNGEQKLVIL